MNPNKFISSWIKDHSEHGFEICQCQEGLFYQKYSMIRSKNRKNICLIHSICEQWIKEIVNGATCKIIYYGKKAKNN